jgi:peroxiredoxin
LNPFNMNQQVEISAKSQMGRSGVSAERRKSKELEATGFLPKAATRVLTALALLLAGCAHLPRAAVGAGDHALAFEARATDGTTVKFPEGYAGKVVLLDFWATWCVPCVRETPNIAAAYDKYHAQGFDVVGVSLDLEGADDRLAAFTKEIKMPWPEIYDGKFWGSAVPTQYGIRALPHAFLVDGDTGLILADGMDLLGDGLAPAIEKALAKKAAK